jgi:alpha-ribazole phosphatase
MLTQLVFLRHGQTLQPNCLLGRTDAELSQDGLAQLRMSAGSLKSVTKVISSPLQRAASFAHEFAFDNQLHCDTQSCWLECDFGEWDGLEYERIAARYPEDYSSFLSNPIKNPPPDGENIASFYQRVVNGIIQLVEKHAEQKLLIVTHGGVIRCAVAWCLGLDFVNQNSLANVPFQRLHVDYASQTQINIWNEDGLLPQLVTFNQTMSRRR